MDERVVERWMALEMGRVHEGLVRAPQPLVELLLEVRPSAPTRTGEHVFDRDALRRLADALGLLTRARLKLPVVFFLDAETHGSCYVQDAAAARALRELGAAVAEPRGGKLWVAEPLAREFARRYPTCAQFAML